MQDACGDRPDQAMDQLFRTDVPVVCGFSGVLHDRFYVIRYGAQSLSRNLIFGGANIPVRSLVIHNDLRTREDGEASTDWHFVNPIAYEIAKRIGCITTATKPVQFYLNGVYQGPYVLTERVSTPNFLASRLGHDDFFLADTESDDGTSTLKQGSDTELSELNDWSHSARTPLSMAGVDEKVNLRNLTDWFISILYSGTTDALQGMIARDRAGKDTRWFWINWDMDQSLISAIITQDGISQIRLPVSRSAIQLWPPRQFS